MTHKAFRELVWNYYKENARPMPWRNIKDPYKILVSEIMLQQTQVPRVLEKYPPFIKRFPTFKALANASVKEVLEEWVGLGYNRRALNLKKTAEIISKKGMPADLTTLPGIGPATAGSLTAFIYNKPSVFIETNIRSVYIHHFFPKRDDVTDVELIPYIEKTVDHDNPREWYYALMDYGTHLKKTTNPSRKSKHHSKQSRFEGSNRQVRANIVKALLEKPLTLKQLQKKIDDERIETNLIALEKEGLISKDKTRYYIS